MQTLIILGLVLGILLILFFVYLQVLRSKCTTKITGKFLKTNQYSSGGNNVTVTYSAPVFKYTFNNEIYEKQTFQCFSQKYIKKHFVANEDYPIYINSKKPKMFIIDEKFQLSDLFILGTGLFFLIVSMLIFFV